MRTMKIEAGHVTRIRSPTAEPVRERTPADRSSGGKINRKLPLSNLSSATSLRRTPRIWASFKQTLSELGDSESMLSNSLTPAAAALAALAAEPRLPDDIVVAS